VRVCYQTKKRGSRADAKPELPPNSLVYVRLMTLIKITVHHKGCQPLETFYSEIVRTMNNKAKG
jgi:hypothetical protein